MEIVGHSRIISFLTQSRKKNNLAQAYLFVGPEQVGKFTVAKKFAQEIIGVSEDKVNPDLLIVKPEVEEKNGIIRKKDIKVATVRKLEKKLALASQGKKNKIAIIDEADLLTVNAQNALLKTLEEPQKKCILILVCHNLTKILPTIQSRCLIKKFNLVQDSEISQMLSDNQNKREIIFWSVGRPGIAKKLKNNLSELKRKQSIQANLKKILQEGINSRFLQAEILSKDSEQLKEILNLWIVLLRRDILKQNNYFHITSQKALLLIDEINKSLEIIQETNANVRLVLESLLLKF
jgi:DNA polymerase-3 subunit delta'